MRANALGNLKAVAGFYELELFFPLRDELQCTPARAYLKCHVINVSSSPGARSVYF